MSHPTLLPDELSIDELRRELDAQRRLVDALELLIEIATSGAPLQEVLQRLLAVFAEQTRVRAGVIRVREGEALRARATVGPLDELTTHLSHPIDEGLRDLITRRRGPLALTSPELDPLLRCEGLRGEGAPVVYAQPLLDRDEILGLVLVAPAGGRVFGQAELRLLGALGARATTAILRDAARETLENAVRYRDEVLAVVAHDLRNPVNLISLAAHTLHQQLQDPPLPADRGRALLLRAVERILRGAERAERLIGDLLDVSAIEAGRFTIDPRRLDLAELLRSVVDAQLSLAAAAQVGLCLEPCPELPPVYADGQRLLEVLENLLDNARKFTPPGGEIRVRAALEEGVVRISVADSGPGIAPADLPNLFDRFWQARKTDRRGAGLGLTICRAIVESHGGEIWAESAPGAGATLHFTLPVFRPQGEAPPVRILLVDDRAENLVALQAILEQPGYRISVATSGEEALRLALKESFTVALIDVAMPRMDGFEVARHLKGLARSRDIPVIFITAFGEDPRQIHRAYEAGGADYLVKPLDAEIVRKKVEVFVNLSRTHGRE